MGLLVSQNQYPECLSMELEAVASMPEDKDNKHFDLYLTLKFGEQWESLLDGRVKLGLKGGILKLELENSEFSSFASDLDDYFQVDRTTSQKSSTWVLVINTNQATFQGTLKQIKLATLQELSQPFRLTATFTVSPFDVSLTDAENLWRHNISPNKHAILERKLVQFLVQTKFQPYLSRLELSFQRTNSEQNLPEILAKPVNIEHLEQLKQLIHQIYTAQTDNFWELANLADLNPLKDFAGGNLLAAELSEISLGGANLRHTNLRGANLTDADLSEANLSQAKLSGADLSGAYLGNANLQNADLHRASLALANLIGADLRGANFEEANISKGNFSGTKVSRAKFKNNPGISREITEILTAGGAIFPDLL